MSLVLAERPGTRPYRNGLTFKPYVYRGQGEDTLTAFMDDEPAEQPTATAEPCWCGGDMRGYRKHLANQQEPCQASRDDVNLYTVNRRHSKRALKVHQPGSDGNPRCGARSTELAANDADVTCRSCRDLDPCGTPGAYKRHLRHEGKPVTCQACLQAEARRAQDSKARNNDTARRRERYQQARAAGLTRQQARNGGVAS